MAIVPIPSAGAALPARTVTPSAAPTSGGGMFTQVLDRFLGDVARQQEQSAQAVRDLALGRTDSVHNVVLEVSRADLAFRLFLEIRNRLTDAYKEVMNMQV